jgi:hypothetical protein
MTWYFKIGQKVWIDGDQEGTIAGYDSHNPERAIVVLRHGFFAHKGNRSTSMEHKGHDTFISTMCVHVSNLSTSEFGERPYEEVE